MNMKRRLESACGKLASIGVLQAVENPIVKRFSSVAMDRHWNDKVERSSSPLLHSGRKYYSQNDEDGIISEIFRRLQRDAGTFVEYGCGDGLENNTILLLMRGWRGLWIDGSELSIRIPRSSKKLWFGKEWVTRENCVEIMKRGLKEIGAESPNLISMDMDGNDLFFVEEILKGGSNPDVFIVEYNAKFPPPIRFSIEYDPEFVWSKNDYFGASLQSFVDLFDSFDYFLSCCNITGANAFFVARRHADRFSDLPKDVGSLFMPPDYNWFLQCGYVPDPRSIESFLAE
jgi:hypothetical protein